MLICGQEPQNEFIINLNKSRINYFHFPVYDLSINDSVEFLTDFQNNETNYLVITSPSSVDGVLKRLAFDDLSKIKAQIISIGPTTSAAIKNNNGQVFHESRKQNINDLYADLRKLIVKT